eukprot:535667_1
MSVLFAFLIIFVTVNGQAVNHTVYCTSYGWDDNSPPSADIAYPKSAGYPTMHDKAYEGKGTYSDPITFATVKDEIPIGSMVYVPYLRKYFIMEDDCGTCHQEWDEHKYHIDLWMGPDHALPSNKLYACEDYITSDNYYSKYDAPIFVDPPNNLPVDTTPLIDPNTANCTAVIYKY